MKKKYLDVITRKFHYKLRLSLHICQYSQNSCSITFSFTKICSWGWKKKLHFWLGIFKPLLKKSRKRVKMYISLFLVSHLKYVLTVFLWCNKGMLRQNVEHFLKKTTLGKIGNFCNEITENNFFSFPTICIFYFSKNMSPGL